MDSSSTFSALDAAIEASMPADLKAAGWTYFDMPRRVRLDEAGWNDLLGVFGDGNYRIIAMSIRQDDGARRAQFLLSPEGRRRLDERISQHEAARPASEGGA